MLVICIKLNYSLHTLSLWWQPEYIIILSFSLFPTSPPTPIISHPFFNTTWCYLSTRVIGCTMLSRGKKYRWESLSLCFSASLYVCVCLFHFHMPPWWQLCLSRPLGVPNLLCAEKSILMSTNTDTTSWPVWTFSPFSIFLTPNLCLSWQLFQKNYLHYGMHRHKCSWSASVLSP